MLLKNIKELVKSAINYKIGAIYNYANICEIENRIRKIASKELAELLAPVLFQLSVTTGTTYRSYLEDAESMLLGGKTESEILWHYENLLNRGKNE